MASTFVNNLRLEEMATGEQSGQWGTKTNTNLELIGEALGFATVNISSDADQTETVADASSDNARALYIKVTSTSLSATRTLTIDPTTVSRVHIIENATTGGQDITIKQGSDNAADKVTIPNGKTKVVYLDGNSSSAKVVDAFAHLSAPDITVDDDLIVGDDVTLKSDGAVLGFGADTDTTLTHADGTGLTLNSTNKLTFGDAASFIQQSSDGTLRIDGEAIIDLNASTRVDVSGDIKVGGEVQTASIGFTDGDNAITIADGGGVTFAQAASFSDKNMFNVGTIHLDAINSDAGTGTAITFGAGNVPNTETDTNVSGSKAPDFSQYTNFIYTLTGNLTLTDPGDEVAGQSGVFVFIQDGSGNHTLSHAADEYFSAGGTAITLSTAANSIDIVPYFVQADGKIHLGAVQTAFADA